MNIRLFASILGLGIFASITLVSINPANAQKNNGSDNGNNTHSVPPCACDHNTDGKNNVTPAVKAEVESVKIPETFKPIFSSQFSDQKILEILPQLLIPINTNNVVLNDNVKDVAKSIKGLLVNGNINLSQLRTAVEAYNKYVEALVNLVGGSEATAIINKNPDLKNTLTALVAAVNK